jgi:exodeoxyribonuclease VII large subunit
MRRALQSRLQSQQALLENMAHKLRLVSPRPRLEGELQRLDALSQRLERAVRAQLERAAEQLNGQARALERANPLSLLARGYALLSDPTTGQPITSAAQAMPNAELDVQLLDGHLRVRVQQRTLRTESDGS